MPIIAALPYLGTAGLAALRLAPSLVRAGSKIIPRGIKRNYPIVPYTGGGLPTVIGGGARVGGGASAGGGSLPAVIGGAAKTGSKGKIPLFRMLGLGTAPFAISEVSDLMTKEAETSANQASSPPSGTEGGAAGSTIEETKKFTAKKDGGKDDGGAAGLDTKIKKGDLDDFIKERMDLFDKYLGDSKGQLKSAGFAALTEFGLNLAQARGGNLMDKIARSAKDPLKTFTAIGMAAKDRADKIKMAAIESGIEAQEAALDRAGDTEGTTFQKNLSTLQAMFTNKDGELTIPQEDLINMAKAGGTTSKKEFFADIIPQLMTTQDPLTMQNYDKDQALSMAEQMWSAISGEEPIKKETSNKDEEIIVLK